MYGHQINNRLIHCGIYFAGKITSFIEVQVNHESSRFIDTARWLRGTHFGKGLIDVRLSVKVRQMQFISTVSVFSSLLELLHCERMILTDLNSICL